MLSGCVTSSLHSKRVCPSSRCLLGASWQILGISWSPLPPSAGQGGNRHRNGPATLVAPVSLRKKWMCVCVCVRLRLKWGWSHHLAGSRTTLGRHQRARGGGDLLLRSLGRLLGPPGELLGFSWKVFGDFWRPLADLLEQDVLNMRLLVRFLTRFLTRVLGRVFILQTTKNTKTPLKPTVCFVFEANFIGVVLGGLEAVPWGGPVTVLGSLKVVPPANKVRPQTKKIKKRKRERRF